MPAKHSRHIALTKPLAEWVDRRVAQGHRRSVGDPIRTAIRSLRESDEFRPARGDAASIDRHEAQSRG